MVFMLVVVQMVKVYFGVGGVDLSDLCIQWRYIYFGVVSCIDGVGIFCVCEVDGSGCI